MIKWSMRSLVLVLMLVVFAACQNTGDNGTNEEGMGNGDNNGVEQTRYDDGQNNTGDQDTPLVDRNHDADMRNSGNANNNYPQSHRYANDRNGEPNNGNANNRNNRNDNRTRNHENNHRNNMNNQNGRNNMNDNNRNNNRYEVADQAADKITDKVDGIDSARVLTTQNNAYVAAKLDNNNNNKDNQNNKVSDDIKNDVSRVVKNVDNDIDNVYVSTNPDFLDLTNNYVDDMNEGKPVKGFFDQMGNMINRLFPNNQ